VPLVLSDGHAVGAFCAIDGTPRDWSEQDVRILGELRRLQYAADDRLGVGKRSRALLDPEYRERYLVEILDRADLDTLVAELPADSASAVLCVEADPEACHRSLIAQRLAERYGLAVTDLRPRAAPAAP